ncbi:MAG: tetratricopeptide repeat protein [Telluria sp.]
MFFRLQRASFAALLCIPLLACKMTNDTKNGLPRNENLPLFQPHVTTFVCEVEATKVPAIDAQAEAWFLEARALEDPNSYAVDPDYKNIVRLTRLAAERRHWKAMLNLASLYLEGQDPPHDVEDAVKLVEEAIRLGIPAAYDRMGTYYMNGTGVHADSTRAYAFWQKAAGMGNPQAMTYLGDRLRAGEDGAIAGYWANIPVAIKMLECALGQGYGPAAYNLHFLYAAPRAADGEVIGERTRETKARALKALHDGVRFGCMDCANALYIEFDHPFDLGDMLVPHIDKARGERYGILGDALGFNPDRRFPNLDKILPLPPADLPPWDGKKATLLAAAMGVTPLSPAPKPTAASQATGRHFLDAEYVLRATGETTAAVKTPMTGYWLPASPQQSEHLSAQLMYVLPGLYRVNENFDRCYPVRGEGAAAHAGVVWERWETIRHNHGAIEPRAARGLVREVTRPAVFEAGVRTPICPATGVWQPWVSCDHPLQAIVNQHWRQTWLIEGQPFPRPEQDWLLPFALEDLTWYLMDDNGAAAAEV